jgi:hypothetical protein
MMNDCTRRAIGAIYLCAGVGQIKQAVVRKHGDQPSPRITNDVVAYQLQLLAPLHDALGGPLRLLPKLSVKWGSGLWLNSE